MSRRWLLSLLCLSSAVVFVQLSAANTSLRVNESATRFLVQDQAIVMLEVVSPTTHNLTAHLRLELLDPKDVLRGLAIRELTLRPGINKLTVPLTLSASSINADADRALPWYRLHYRIAASSEGKPVPDAASGIISLSEIDTPNIFAMEVSAPSRTHRSARHHTHIRTFNPKTSKPIKYVNVSVELNFDDAKGGTIKGSAVTNAAGYALVAVNIPARTSSDEGEMKVVARHGGYIRESTNDIELDDGARIMVTTDKPIYQPGQPLHIRALVFDTANRAAANAEATLTITDPENTEVFETSLLTSRFGVATADWPIPENTRLGDYAVRIQMDDENYGDSEGSQTVKISRYDLPTFAVSVKPNRAFYLPGQNAGIEVRADYLFGQPVKRGQVRVVREEEREWNFVEQKWDIEASQEYEGQADDAGVFLVHIDLQKDHKELADREYSRFTDLTFAAYLTDPTTNRTEQRRFDLRVTKDAIHIYVAEGPYRQAEGLPMQFYLATSQADGTPVPCEVAIMERAGDDKSATARPVLRSIRTNKFGIAKVSDLKLSDAAGNGGPSLDFTARNDTGYTGHHTESFYYRSVPVIRIDTDKTLYRPGEPIKVNVTASEPDMNMVVEVSRDSNIVESQALSLHGRTATFTLRNRPEFQDEVTISAFSKSQKYSYYNFPFGSRTVLFPRNRDLNVNFRMDHAAYKPGEDAMVDFRISMPDGRPASSALGVVIFDRAVEERARTDQEFRGGFGFSRRFSEWRGYDNQIGGITRKVLQNIDPAKPLPEGMELVAEMLLGAGSAENGIFDAEGFETAHSSVFAELTGLHVGPLRNLLETQYKINGTYPANGESLRRLLFESEVDFDQLRDPWGTLYREKFSIERDDSILEIISAGPDKAFATKDDLTVARIARPYFRFAGEAISRAVERFHARTGGFIRDAATLKNELRAEGIDFDSLRDPWGQPYEPRFTTVQNKLNLTVRSSGPDKRFADAATESDDFTLWLAGIDYLTETRARMEKALAQYFKKTNRFPQDDSELQRAFLSAGIGDDQMHDPWGHRFYAKYTSEARKSDRSILQTFATYGQQSNGSVEIVPVTQQVSSILLRSGGEDGKKETADDFDVADFWRLTAEYSGGVGTAQQPSKQSFLPGPKGAIKGTVVDSNGASVAGAKVKGTLKNSSHTFETETDDQGRFLLRNLPVGFYELRCDAPGFMTAVVQEILVSSSNLTTVNFSISPGTVSETVTITASADSVDLTTQSATTTVTEGRLQVSIGRSAQIATPRLRDYFPETLVWQPSLETDKQGRAQLKFKLADNITTWKMSVIGSTEDGEIGTAETEIKAFQPFFVEHDPPRVLTEGDQISLPVVLRNYLERAQTVDLEIRPESWFTLGGSPRQRATVPAGDAARQIFELQAVASVKDGKQRITARGPEASDAIEKPVTVHPDGEEKTQTASGVFGDALGLDLNLPASAIPGSAQAELKIYPSLMGHVVESIEGILERPHGCGEQTISSTYPSLLVLRRNKQTTIGSKIVAKAKNYAGEGYRRLLNYRTEDGGFSYWGRGEADLALSAYALRFLHDAGEFVAVDPAVVKDLRQWLMKRQNADGSWPGSDYDSDQEENQPETALLTAFVARVLAMTEPAARTAGAAPAKQQAVQNVSPELKRALSYLSGKIETINEPYLIASYALAAIDAGDLAGAKRATAKLRTLAHSEGDTTHWKLDTNTPFNGWGSAGLVETTALAIQALTQFEKTQPSQAAMSVQSTDRLVRGGLLYLLRQKDRYGVWYSTQATINVLDTLIMLLGSDAAPNKETAGQGAPIEVIINGQFATSVKPQAGDQNAALISTNLSGFLRNGPNHIELRRGAGSELATVQLVANYYVPWSTSGAAQNTATKPGETSALRLSATFDKKSARINEEIVCTVKAERIGSASYGMMLAEIGLPPGADVDRASLDSAMKSSGWAISQYDVLPDRVVVYLWSRAGGVHFAFKFRPRFALTAKAAPSIVYDYYNPEARAVVEPATFLVR